MYRQPSPGGALTRGPNRLDDRAFPGEPYVNGLFPKPATIYSLPPELLLLIFRGYGLRELWVRAAHVCRRWRNLVFNTPTLWRTILVKKNLDWLKHCLRLSNPLLVTVVFAHSYLDFPAALEVMHEGFSHRIEVLDSYVLVNCSSIPEYLPFPTFPNLKKILIRLEHAEPGVSDPHDCHSPSLALDSDRFPKLTNLDLCGLRVTSIDPKFHSQLTRLSLNGWEGDISGEQVPSLQEMLSTLAHCTALESLALMSLSDGLIRTEFSDMNIWRSLIETQGMGTLVKLPKLRRLILTDDNRLQIPYLLSHMELSPDVEISLVACFDMCFEPEESWSTFTVTDYLLKLLPEPEHRRGLPVLKHINRVRIHSFDGHRLQFLGQREDESGQLVPGAGAMEITVANGLEDQTRDEMSGLGVLQSDISQLFTPDTLAALLPATNIRTFIFCPNLWTSTLSTPAMWTTILSSFPELRTLWVYNAPGWRKEPEGNILRLVHALGEQGVQQDVPASVPCPHLTSLSIGQVAAEDALFDALKTTLEWRAQRTPPLKDLCLHLKAHPVKPLQPEALGAHHAALRSLVGNLDTSSRDVFAALHYSLDDI